MPHDQTEWFLAQAEECERQADQVRDESARSLYRLLARQWRRLAEQAANRQRRNLSSGRIRAVRENQTARGRCFSKQYRHEFIPLLHARALFRHVVPSVIAL